MWARNRRAAWTDQPLEPAAPVIEPASATAPPVVRDESPSIAASVAARARTAAPSIARWLAVAAVGGALAGAAWAGLPYVRRALSDHTAPRPEAETVAPAGPATTAPPTVGELRVSSTPTGARVLVDGKERGLTPLTLTDVRPGIHEITLASSAGTVRRSVKVAANQAVDVDESIFPGWVAVLAPFDVEVSEEGRALRFDEREQILLAPGVHDLRLGNAALNYVTVQHVEVKPGATTTLRVTPPSSKLTVTAAAASEVWLDGARVGETPLYSVPAPLGTHEIVVRRAGGVERRFTVTIGTSPFVLNADSGR